MEATQYIIPDHPIPLESLQFGSFVCDFTAPTDHPYFNNALASERDLVRRVDHDLEEVMTRTSNGRKLLSRLSLTSLLEFDDNKRTRLSSVQCRRHDLLNASAWYYRCGSDGKFNEWVDSLIFRGCEVIYSVTGFRTMENGILVTEAWSLSSITTHLDWASDRPAMPLDFKSEKSVEGHGSFWTEKENIIAVTYRKVKLGDVSFNNRLPLQSETDWLDIARKTQYLHLHNGMRRRLPNEVSVVHQIVQSSHQIIAASQLRPYFSTIVFGLKRIIRITEVKEEESTSRFGRNMLVLEEIDYEQLDTTEIEGNLGINELSRLNEDNKIENDDYAKSKAIVRLLLADISIATRLVGMAVFKISFNKVFGHLRICFYDYYEELKSEAQTDQERVASEFIRYHYEEMAVLLARAAFLADEDGWTDPETITESNLVNITDQLDRLDQHEKPIAYEGYLSDDGLPIRDLHEIDVQVRKTQRQDMMSLSLRTLEDFCKKGEAIEWFGMRMETFVAENSEYSSNRKIASFLSKSNREHSWADWLLHHVSVLIRPYYLPQYAPGITYFLRAINHTARGPISGNSLIVSNRRWSRDVTNYHCFSTA